MKKREIRRRELELQELEVILARTQEGALSPDDHEKPKAAVDTLAFLTRELEVKGTSIDRLRRILGEAIGSSSRVVGSVEGAAGELDEPITSGQEKEKRPGHGCHGVAAYRGADKVPVPHESPGHGDRCPACERGKVCQCSPEGCHRFSPDRVPLGA